MLPSLKNLEVINFGDCLVKTEGAKALAKSLRTSVNNLKELNLSFDEINKEGALAIVEALESKDSLKKLELNGGYTKQVVCLAAAIVQIVPIVCLYGENVYLYFTGRHNRAPNVVVYFCVLS